MAKSQTKKEDKSNNLAKAALAGAAVVGAGVLTAAVLNNNEDIRDKAENLKDKVMGEADELKDEAKANAKK